MTRFPQLRPYPHDAHPAIILGRYSTTNLGAIHSLAAHHIPTIVIDARRQSSFFSRCTTGIQSPNPTTHPHDYITFLQDLSHHLPQPGILFPTGDTETLLLAQHANDLNHYYSTSAPYDLLNTLINKHSLADLLTHHHIPHPITYTIDPTSDLASLSATMTYPCILKPQYPTQFRLDFPLKAFYATTPTEFREYSAKAATKGHAMIAQEIIPGTAQAMHGFNAYYDTTGNPHAPFEYQRIREWPLEFGNGCFLQHVHEPSLETMTTSLLKPLKYHGIVDVEFRYDHRDDTFKLIEINPRLWMQNNFPASLGYNHAYLAYLDALQQPLPPDTYSKSSPTRWVFGAEDLHSSLAALQKGTLSVGEWLSAYRPTNIHATFSYQDPMPWVVAAYRSVVWSCSLALHRKAENPTSLRERSMNTQP